MSSSTKKNKTQFTGTRGQPGVSRTSKKSYPAASVDSQSRVRKSIYGGASRTLLSSASRKNAQLGSEKLAAVGRPPVQVFNEAGQDVTPLPLSQFDPNSVKKNQSNVLGDSSAGTPTDLMSQASVYQTGTINASTFGGGPFTRSVFSASVSGRSTGSITDDLGEPTADIGSGWTETKVQYKREEVREDLTEEDLDKIIDMNLSETETIWLLDMPGICVSVESEEAVGVREQNSRYQELIKGRAGNDRYMERGMNTFNEPPKFKNVQTTKVSHVDVGVTASTWDMHDTYVLVKQLEAKVNEEVEEEEGTVSRPVSAAQGADSAEKKDSEKEDATKKAAMAAIGRDGTTISLHKSGLESQTMSSMGGTDSVFASKESGVTAVPEQGRDKDMEILQSDELKRNLVIMERVVNLNTYQPKQAQYRGFDIIKDVVEQKEETEEAQTEAAKKKKKEAAAVVIADLGPNLDRLWAYQCPLTKGRNVSCVAWNKVNPDLLAVGYGQFEFTNQKGGLVCCWSLKNPEYPERIYTTTTGVTSLDFSVAHPNLLAVGMYDGTVAIYNVRNRENETVLDSLSKQYESESSGKHTGPVWQLRWIEKERGSGEERAEVLVSVSTDGRVTQWSIRKGFESYDLMKLKRVQAKTTSRVKKTEAFISRFAGGLCFDFSAKDSNIYLAGTEDGHIHRCSCSYNEQYLDSYFGHTGPVYKIQWSPFCSDVFLSCSGDWSLRLWHQERLQPVLNFHSSTKAVPDVCWSPHVSTVFACVNEGAVEVWDLSQSTLDPIIVNTPVSGTKLSTVTFAKNSTCLLVGDSDGQVTVYELRGMPESTDAQGEALQKILQSSLASQLQSDK